ncbi:Leucine-rich repeat soc-2-like protein [Nymphaea thermarum]|nr:Leucine-rich repeat soc-2-like protein [Nymphaea thermarum]
MVTFAALSILFGYVLRKLLRQFSPNQNVNRRIRGNMEAGEGVEPLTPSPRAGGSEFEVFLSFKGEDIQKGFIGHLLDGLKECGISTFIDSEKLEKGEEINNLLEYIERSKIFVPIFSQGFAESKWCLKEGPETIDAEGIEISFYENYCTVGAQCFENMPNLRYLNAKNVTFQCTFPCFPTDLKWLQLERCHFDSPTSEFNLEKLVILDLYETNMAPILRLKAFERLKVLSIYGVKTKITFDFTNTTSLVTLRFLNCSALTTIDESIGKLKNLKHLSTSRCRLLQILPDSIWRLSSLEVLNISWCWEISSLPERLGELGSLKKLDLSFTSIERLPDSICRLSSLEMLCLKGCLKLRSIPEGLGDMESLKKIDLSCPRILSIPANQIEVIPDSIGQLTNLVELSLCGSQKLGELPDSICQLKLLKSLDLEQCVSLRSLPERLGDMEKLEKLILAGTIIKSIPDSIGQLKLLKSIDLSGCFSLCALPERLGDMEKLEELILDNTRIEAIPDSVGQLHNLRLLSLKGCKFIKALPISIRQLSSIQRLEMSGTNLKVAEIDLPHVAANCFIEFTGSSSELHGLSDQIHKALEILRLKDATIEDLPDCVGRMEKLKELRLECQMLKELPNWIERSLENLTQLEVRSKHLKVLPDCIGSLKQMSKLELKCVNLETLPDSIGELENVYFFIIQSAKLKALPTSIGRLKKLREFEVSSNSLEALPDSIGSLKHVQTLTIRCPNLEALPDFARLSSLRFLNLTDCKGLEYLPQLSSSLRHLKAFACTNLRKMDISNLQNLKSLWLGCCKQLEDVPGLENISSNLEVLELPGPCDFTGCCHFSHDFKNKVFKILGSLVPGSAKGQQQLQFMLPRLPFSRLRTARVSLTLKTVLLPICIAIVADEVTLFEKIVEVKDRHFVRLKLGEESIMNIGEGAHCYTMQVTMDVSQLKNVEVFLEIGGW